MTTHTRRPAARRAEADTAEAHLLTASDPGRLLGLRSVLTEHEPTTWGPVVGRADAAAEAQADRMADAALQGGASVSAGATVHHPADAVLRRTDGCTGDELGGRPVDRDVAQTLASRRGTGRPLDRATARSMSAGFGGHDFSGVRLHTDPVAHGLTQAVQATAFTQGSDIYFSRGSYDPASSAGQGLMAHELAHVVQGGDTVRRRILTKAEFKKATQEGSFAGRQRAQKDIGRLLDTYERTFVRDGVVAAEDYPRALVTLRELERMAELWLEDNSMTDPDTEQVKWRKSRTYRFITFDLFLGGVRDEIKAFESGPLIPMIGPHKPSKEFSKTQSRYEGDLQTFLMRCGGQLEKLVPEEGSRSTLDLEFQAPVDPTGIGYVGGKLSAEVSRDEGMTQIRARIGALAGGQLDFGQVGAELAGNVTAQAPNANQAMELISYGLYRRLVESHVIPREISSFVWGGDAGEFGRLQADRWSKRVEKDRFGVLVPPTRANFAKDFPGATADQLADLYALELERIEEVNLQNSASFVETGSSHGAALGIEGQVFDFSAGVEGGVGRRYDATSMDNRKGGAGQANRKSDSFLAKGARGLTSDRGAEKRLGRDIETVSASASCNVGFPGLSAAGALSFEGKYQTQGLRKTRGNKHEKPTAVSEVTSLTLKLDVMGSGIGETVGADLQSWAAKKVDLFERAEAAPNVRKKLAMLVTSLADDAGTAASATTGKVSELAAQASAAVNGIGASVDDAMRRLGGAAAAFSQASARELFDSVVSRENAEAAATALADAAIGVDGRELTISYDSVSKAAVLEVRAVKGRAMRVEGKAKGSQLNSTRLYRATLKGGTWTIG